MAYNYSSFVAALAAAVEVDPADADFLAVLPTIVDLAEQRIYRELDLVSSSVVASGAMTPNSRYATLPTSAGHLVVVEQVNVLDAGNTRHPLKLASRDLIDFIWPSDTALSASVIPDLFSRVDDTRILVGSAPGTAWNFEVVGTIRPAPLSASNTTTFLSSYLSDLFFAAAMVAAAGVLLKNYGAQADSPQQATSWESVYQRHFASANAEELRKQFGAVMSPPVKA